MIVCKLLREINYEGSRKPFRYLVVDVLVNFARNIIFSKSGAAKIYIWDLVVFRLIPISKRRIKKSLIIRIIYRLNTTNAMNKKKFFCKDSISNIDDMLHSWKHATYVAMRPIIQSKSVRSAVWT